jgi:hypothetical protein
MTLSDIAIQESIAKRQGGSAWRFGGWFEQDFPYPGPAFMQQQHLDLAAGPDFLTAQSCRDDLRIIDDNDVTSMQIAADIGENIVCYTLSRPINNHQA